MFVGLLNRSESERKLFIYANCISMHIFLFLWWLCIWLCHKLILCCSRSCLRGVSTACLCACVGKTKMMMQRHSTIATAVWMMCLVMSLLTKGHSKNYVSTPIIFGIFHGSVVFGSRCRNHYMRCFISYFVFAIFTDSNSVLFLYCCLCDLGVVLLPKPALLVHIGQRTDGNSYNDWIPGSLGAAGYQS